MMKKKPYLIILFVILGIHLIFIPIDIIFGLDIISVVSLILTLIIVVIMNYQSIKISKIKYKLQTEDQLTKKEQELLNYHLLLNQEIKKLFFILFLINLSITIIYIVLVNL